MSITIRLSRFGKKNQPTYRVLVHETRSKLNGKYIDQLGSYDPNIKPPSLVLDRQKLDSWIKKGALISTGLRKILSENK